MAFRLQIKRGTLAPNTNTLTVGEFGYDTVAKQLYIGNATDVGPTAVLTEESSLAAAKLTGTIDIARLPTITVAKGGTGLTSLTANSLIYASSSSAFAQIAPGANNTVLTIVGGVPQWATTGTASQVANSLVVKFDTGTTEGTDLYTFNGSAAKTIDIQGGNAIGISKSANTIIINHDDTSSQGNITASGRTYITGVTLDTYGHVTGLTTGSETVVDTDTTYSISAETATGGANLRLTDSSAGTDDVKFASGSGLTVARTDANTITISHNDTSSQTSVDNSGRTVIQDITLDGFGHVTAIGSYTIPDDIYLSSAAFNTTNGVITLTKSDSNTVTVDIDGRYIYKNASSTDGYVPTWSGTGGDTLGAGYAIETTLTGSSSALPRADAVKTYVDGLLSSNDAMVFKGTLGTGGTITALPTTYSAGWAYKVITAGTYAGIVTEIGDLIIAVVDRSGSGNLNSDWTVVQTNLDGAVIGPASAVSANFASFNGTTGKLIQDSGYSASSFAAASHTHAITSDITAGNWKVFYSNGSGAITELALGSAGTVLQSNGASSAPTFVDYKTSFTELDDTPGSYASGDAGKLVAVNASYNGLEFINSLDCGSY